MTVSRRRWLPRWLLAAGDLALINAGMFLAFYARFGAILPQENYEPFVALAPWVSLIGLLWFSGLRLYSLTPITFVETAKRVLLAVFLLFLATMALTFWVRGFAFPRSVLILGTGLQAVLMVTWRLAFSHLERLLHGERPVLIVVGALNGKDENGASASGTNELSLISRYLNIPRGWYRLHSIVPWWDEGHLAEELRSVDSVLIAPSVPPEEKSQVAILALRHGREVFIIPDFYDLLLLHAHIGQVDDLPVIEVPSLGLSPAQAAVKRALDVVVSVPGLILTLPLMLILALLIRLTSPGPVLYRQERVGLAGHTFTLYKFRTMDEGAETETGPVLATEDDSRITPVGRFLRAVRLDELPQLWNILRGEMSLVGPRPERPVFVKQYTALLPDYTHRHLVKPGLTGLAQVMGRYSTETVDKLRYDLYYIRNYNLFLDLKILLHTLQVLFSPSAARGVQSPGVAEQAAARAFLDKVGNASHPR